MVPEPCQLTSHASETDDDSWAKVCPDAVMALSCMIAFEKQGPCRTKIWHFCIGVQIHYVDETLEGVVNLLCL